MSRPESWLHARAAGMDLLISTMDLREVIGATPVSPVPGGPRGIQGVVIHQGEFLPILAWGDLPGCPARPAPPVALAVLRPRLGVPLERLVGTVEVPPEGWREPEGTESELVWLGRVGRLGEGEGRLLDPDRLADLLRRFRVNR
jgi:chemotaxis signal transduction protein